MRLPLLGLVGLLVAVAATSTPLLGAETAAPTGLRGDFLRDLADLEKKAVALAEAVPADKYSWRPAEGVRSISEALMHLAGANYYFPTLFGTAAPTGVDIEGLEKITDRDRVLSTLKASFAHLTKVVEGTPDGKLPETMKMFGQDVTVAGGIHVAVAHIHEHLGQLIAYARSIGVAPPWSG
jgi:uncharacterized damage-inducible protein DinB